LLLAFDQNQKKKTCAKLNIIQASLKKQKNRLLNLYIILLCTRISVPDGCDLVAAGALPAAFGTSHLALVHRAQLKCGQVGSDLDLVDMGTHDPLMNSKIKINKYKYVLNQACRICM
jgi:hypothetical protein